LEPAGNGRFSRRGRWAENCFGPRFGPERVVADRTMGRRGCRSGAARGSYRPGVSERDDNDFGVHAVDFSVRLGPGEGNRAFFGRNVLQGLIDGIDDFVHECQPRWERRTHRIGAPVMLACSPWVSDDKLIEALPGACILISKHPRRKGGDAGGARLREVNSRTNGIELRALSALAGMAPKVGGRPRVIGPYDRIHDDDSSLSTFRTIAYRKTKELPFPPIVHAKLALLGNICWTDEHPAGGVDDYIWFSPKRLWVSSANFTYGSRSSLEFGYWTEEEDLVSGVARFLGSLIGASEPLDSAADAPSPELAPVEYDDVAMAQAWAEHLQAREENAAIRGEDLDDEER
jgi:hypothetical protein